MLEQGRSGSGEELSLTVIPIPHPLHCMKGGGRRVKKLNLGGRGIRKEDIFSFGLLGFFLPAVLLC